MAQLNFFPDGLLEWMCHASMEVTAIYADALGAEERGIAARMWA